MKQNFFKILMPDGKIRKFNLYDDYETKVKNINEIYEQWKDYIEDSWDKAIKVKDTKITPVANLLDKLTYYLLYESQKDMTENNIVNGYKTNKNRKRELLVPDIQEIKDEDKEEKKPQQLDKRYERFQHLKHIDLNMVNHIRFSTIKGLESHNTREKDKLKTLRTIDNNLCLCVLEKYYNKSMDKHIGIIVNELLWNYRNLKYTLKVKARDIKEKNYLLQYAKKSYTKTLTTFEKINLFRKHNINPSLPYSAEWITVDTDGCFSANNTYYKIYNYQFDKVLYYEQGEKKYFLDAEIKLIKNVQKI